MRLRIRYSNFCCFDTDLVFLNKNQLRNAIALRVKDGAREIDVLHWTTRTALELIGQSGLGMRQLLVCFCLSYSCHPGQATVLTTLMMVLLMNIA
jgi:hypothetical protein